MVTCMEEVRESLESSSAREQSSQELPRRRLGQTELTVTPLGLGGAWLGHTKEGLDEDLGVETVLHALDLGIRLIDTSATYLGSGRSERIIGTALQEWYRRGGRREELVISTKTGTRDRRNRDYSAEGTRRSVAESLELLQTEYLDVLLVHDPHTLEPVLAPDGAWSVLKELKAQGTTRAIGMGVRTHELHRQLMATGECDVILTHSDFHLLRQSALEGVIKPAVARGVGVFVGTTLVQGLLGGREPRQVVRDAERRDRSWVARLYERLGPEIDRAQAMWEWAQAHELNLLALNLQYIARHPQIGAILVGASQPHEVSADVAALQAPIPEALWDEFSSTFNLP